MSAVPTTTGAQIPYEFVGLARTFRARIAGDEARYVVVTDRILTPLRPRPAWPTPTKLSYLKDVAGGYEHLKSPCRLFAISEIDDGKLNISDVFMTATRISGEGWSESAIRLLLRFLACPPFEEQVVAVADVGLHALARRYERGHPADEDAVRADLRAIAGSAVRVATAADGGDFEIPGRGGGRWRGNLADTARIRTFVA